MTRTLVLAFFLCLAVGATANADPAITTTATAMRAAPSAKARLVQHVPGNAEIDLNQCSRAWCYASWRNYLPAATVAAQPDPAASLYGPPPAVVGSEWGGGVGPFYYGGWYSRW
jgi:hypothetical protein